MRNSSRCIVGDVAKAIVNVLDLDAASGHIYELGGPTVYTLEELVKYCGDVIGKHARIIRLPESLGAPAGDDASKWRPANP